MRSPALTHLSRAAATAMMLVSGILTLSSALAQPAGQTAPNAAPSDEATVQSLAAVRTDNHPRIDGELGDACWQRAPRVGNFVQHEPEDGKAVSESTTVQVAYDDDAMYVAMEMHDSHPDKIVNRLTRRDRDQDADCAYVVARQLSRSPDRRTCSWSMPPGPSRTFTTTTTPGTTPAGTRSGSPPPRSPTTAGPPSSRYPSTACASPPRRPTPGESPCGRYMTRNQEHDRWPHIPESASGFVSQFAHLTGIENILPAKQLEVLPFAVSYEETEAKHLGNPDGRDFYGNAGLDLKYGLTPNMTLNATFNPDFGQVEADQTVLNLTAFETFYAEKRPFFLEGSSIFQHLVRPLLLAQDRQGAVAVAVRRGRLRRQARRHDHPGRGQADRQDQRRHLDRDHRGGHPARDRDLHRCRGQPQGRRGRARGQLLRRQGAAGRADRIRSWG